MVRTLPLRSRVTTSGAATEEREGLFHALQKYPIFRRLWMGSLLAQLGQWMQSVALGWLALSLTDSPFFVGLVGFMAGLPFIVVAIPAGVLIDRFDRRKVLLACQAAAALLATIVALDVILGHVAPWHLLIAAFLNGSLQAILSPTQQAMTPSLVERKDLTNAIGLTSAGNNMTRVFGPSLAGAVIGFAGTGAAFMLQAVALLVAFALIFATRFPVQRSGVAARPRAAIEGLQILLRRPDLRGLFLLAVIPNFFAFPYIQFLTVFARDILKIGASGLGLLMATSGTGAVIGSLLVAGRRKTEGQGRPLVAMTVIYGLIIIGVSASRSVLVTLPLLLLAGLLGSLFMSQNNALLQLRISDDIRGRVMGAYMLNWGLLPLGAMPMGIIAGLVGTPIAVAIGASLTVVLTLLTLVLVPAIRDL